MKLTEYTTKPAVLVRWELWLETLHEQVASPRFGLVQIERPEKV